MHRTFFLIINYEQSLLLLLVILLSFMNVIFIFITHQRVHLLNQMLKSSFNTLPPNKHLEGYHTKGFFRNSHFTYKVVVCVYLYTYIRTVIRHNNILLCFMTVCMYIDIHTLQPYIIDLTQRGCHTLRLRPLYLYLNEKEYSSFCNIYQHFESSKTPSSEWPFTR